jgi:hypothetical protein
MKSKKYQKNPHQKRNKKKLVFHLYWNNAIAAHFDYVSFISPFKLFMYGIIINQQKKKETASFLSYKNVLRCKVPSA